MVARARICLLLLVSAALLAACGSDESIPEDSAEVLLLRLDEVERAVPDGRCEGALASAELLTRQVGRGEGSELPADVDPEVRELLEAGAARLVALVEQECVEPEVPEVPEETEPIEPAVPEETEPIEPPDPEPDPPDDQAPQGRGPDGTGPPGQNESGAVPPSGGTDAG